MLVGRPYFVGCLCTGLFMRLGYGVFLGCDILVDGPIILQSRMRAVDSFYIFAEARFFPHPGQHLGQHPGHIPVLRT